MDARLMLVLVAAVAIVAFMGTLFASPGNWQNGTSQGMPAFNRAGCGMGQMPTNGTQDMPELNRAGCGMNGTQNMPGLNRTRAFSGRERVMNDTARKEFEAAVEGGDFAAARKLNKEYGFGGPMFSKLNETTFAKFSQIERLGNELRGELGLNESMAPPMGGFGQEGMRPGNGRFMRHGNGQNTDQTQQ